MKKLLSIALLSLWASFAQAATAYVTEFSWNPQTVVYQAAMTGPGLYITTQTLAIGVSSVSSAAFSQSTTLIRINVDTTCSVSFGTAPTATTTSMRIPANQTEYFVVPPGTKVAVIANN